jgi:hypothetical protein
MKSSIVGPFTKAELAAILMTYGVGASALRDLGVSQERFWRLARRPTKIKGKKP